MQVLWHQGPLNVAAVQRALGKDSELAYTTVATMLRKMEDRGLVSHQADGRRFIYAARVGAGEVTRSMADDLVDRVFSGSLADTVNHLLQTREVGPGELRELERLIDRRKRQP